MTSSRQIELDQRNYPDIAIDPKEGQPLSQEEPKSRSESEHEAQRELSVDRRGKPAIPTNSPKYKSKAKRTNFLSYINFWWLFKTCLDANRLDKQGKMLDETYLDGLDHCDRAEVMEEKIVQFHAKRKQKKPNKKPNIALAILYVIRWKLIVSIIVDILFVSARLFSAWVAKKLLDAILNLDIGTGEANKWAGALVANLVVALYLEHHCYYLKGLFPLHVRGALISVLYTKVTKLSVYALNKISLGKLVNIAANDVNVLERTGLYFQNIFTGLYAFIAGGALLWIWFGPCCLIGLGYLLLNFPIQGALAKGSVKPRDKQTKATDERTRLTSELIEGIRIIKMYTWELVFRDRIKDVRKKEAKQLQLVQVWECMSRGIAFSSQVVASFLIFLLYSVTGGDLIISKVFPAFYIINLLRMFSMFYLSMGLAFCTEAKMLLKRVSLILDVPDMQKTQFEEPKDEENAVELENFSAFWTKEESDVPEEALEIGLSDGKEEKKPENEEVRPTIRDVTLKLKKGSINGLVGKVGCGKTSFLLAFTGEMPKTTGSLRFKGSLAYVEQEPTIFAGTIRENILFGKEYKPEFYNRVLKACNLESDLQLFSDSDLSEVGEKGTNLSGGQKARLGLARAVYADADIYLLDDPLSAVDAKVAKSLYQDALCGILKGKTIILSTHQVHFVKDLESIIILDDGTLGGHGSYEQLKEQYGDINNVFKPDDDDEHKGQTTEPEHPQGRNAPAIIGEQKPTRQNEPTAKPQEDERKPPIDERKRPSGAGKLVTEESMLSNDVNFQTYLAYFKEVGGPLTWLFVLLIFVFNEFVTIAFSIFIAFWALKTFSNHESITIVAITASISLVWTLFKDTILALLLTKASSSYHNKMLNRIARSPVSFFDTNPLGRILNRFSNDMGVLDRALPTAYLDVADCVFFIFSLFIAVGIITPVILGPIGVSIVVIVLLYMLCYESIRQSRGFELTSRSPLFSQFSATLSGIIIIRLYNQSDNFISKFRTFLNYNTQGSCAFSNTARFFGFYVDFAYNLAAYGSFFILIAIRRSSGGLSGLILIFLIMVTGVLQYVLRQVVQTHVLMASVARVRAYCIKPVEAPLKLKEDAKVQEKGWPTAGEIDFDNVYMRYRAGMDYVVKSLTLNSKPGEKIGCIGRTGAGKSSIIQILFRMVEIEQKDRQAGMGRLHIDGVDTKTLGLHLLRNSISIIPQTPFVFTGSIKQNLDPLSEHSDEELWKVLEEVRLKEHVKRFENGIETDMTDASSVFSVGQKQLVCLARAILKKTKILVLDEATANVDRRTDDFIQKTIIEKFSDCTIFTIAHRLSTIANYDKVLVLDKGIKVEFDEPFKLLVKDLKDDKITNETGHFASMVLNTGPKTSMDIFNISKEAYMLKHEGGGKQVPQKKNDHTSLNSYDLR